MNYLNLFLLLASQFICSDFGRSPGANHPTSINVGIIGLQESSRTGYIAHEFSKDTLRTVRGRVVDKQTGEPLLFANVFTQDASQGTQTDLNGLFTIELPSRQDTILVAYTGYATRKVFVGDLKAVVIEMESGPILEEVIVIDYKVPLIEQDNTTLGGIVTADQIRNLPTKNINSLAGTTVGSARKKDQSVNIRGSRTNATNYYIDGVRVTGGHDPQQKIKPEPEEQFNTEDYDFIVENEFQSPVHEPLSTFSIDVDRASYANMRRFIEYGQYPPKDAVRIEEMINYFDYAYPPPTGDHPITLVSEVGTCPWNAKHKLVHLGLQAKRIPTENLPPSNLVFLLDVSGSMSAYNKLPLVRESFKMLVENLREKDRVAIVVYAGASGLALPSTAGTNKAAIYEALDALTAGGSTAGAEGIKLAYKVAREHFIEGGNNRVILATDGDFNVGVSSDGELVNIIEEERKSGVFLTVLGYGMGNYKDNKMQKLADHGNGNHGYIDDLEEAKKVFVHEFGGTLFTVAKDVKLQVEFNPALVAGYRLIGYENRMLEAKDFNDDLKDAGEMGAGHTVTALYEIIPAGVDSEFLGSVDDLKYQKGKTVQQARNTDELMTVKFRYKDPDGSTSKLLEQVVTNQANEFGLTSDNFRWSAAVASFGMLLRESRFKGDATLEQIETWAKAAKGRDEHGYKLEFITLVQKLRNVENESTVRR